MKKMILALAILLSGAMVAVTPVFADLKYDADLCSDATLDESQKEAAGCNAGSKNAMQIAINVINAVIGVIALIAVVVIVMAGQRYISSAGDVGKLTQAKDMILYAVVALVVSGLAFAIVNFVSGIIKSDANTNTMGKPNTSIESSNTGGKDGE